MKNNSLSRPDTKSKLHPRNKHRARYDLGLLKKTNPQLTPFVGPNKYGDESIDFSDPKAVTALNTALIFHYYGISYWQIPSGYLCPAVPGRADYIHYIADLISSTKNNHEPIKCLDIGIGANCIYPIIGTSEYGWHFIGTEIDQKAYESAMTIIQGNPNLAEKVRIKLIQNTNDFYTDVLREEHYLDVVICNPPFHKSAADAHKGTKRKLKNLNNASKFKQNFGGSQNELWCEGGEVTFISSMILQSKKFAKNVGWFTSLVSKKEHLKPLNSLLKKQGIKKSKIIEMGQGQKQSRILAWTYQK